MDDEEDYDLPREVERRVHSHALLASIDARCTSQFLDREGQISHKAIDAADIVPFDDSLPLYR